MFGQPQQQQKFGFGTQPSSTNLFGATSAANTGFGSFGAAKHSGGLFGATTTTATPGFGGGGGLFGGTSTAGSGLFGTTTTTAQPAAGGLFGQPSSSSFLGKPATSNAFGTTTGFGANNTGSLFAAPTTQATQPSGGMFGASTSTGGGLFGAGGGFSSIGGASTTGTSATKFAAVDGTDNMVRNGISTQVKTKHYCISGMKQYENKSMEELRLEDYAAGVKGPKSGPVPAASTMFGTSAAQPAAASTGFGGFGTTAATSASTGFGGFGTTVTQASTGFGSKPGGLFGSATPASGGLFGQTSTATPAFGATATSTTGGLFGSTAAAKPNPFGTTTGFGTAGFGQTSTASTGFGGFGAKPVTGFGATTTAATGFGGFGTQPAASTGFGAFGAKTTPAFGAQPACSTIGFGGGFGTLAQTGFGLNKPATGFGTGSAFGTNTLSTLNTNTAQQQQPVQLASNMDLQTQQALMQQQIFTLANSPYGDSPLFRNVKKESKSKANLVPTDPVAQQSVLSSSGSKLKVSARPAAKVKLTNLPSVQAIGTASTAKGDLFEGLEEESFTPDHYSRRRSVKKLVMRSSPAPTGTSSRITTAEQQPSVFSSHSLYSAPARADVTPNPITAEDSFNLSGAKVARRPVNKLYPVLPELDDTIDQLQGGSSRPPKPSPVDRKPVISESTYVREPSADDTSTTPRGSRHSQGHLSVSKQENVDIVSPSSDPPGIEDEELPPAPHPCGVICTRTDYYTLPAIDELENYLDANGDCFVENLSIGREGYGSVFFPGTTNVANLDIDSVVHFRRKEITIYPDDDNKPCEGQGLNKQAEVTLDCVWPNDKTSRSPIKSPDRLKVMNYQDKIEQATARIGAKFIDYRPDTGSWVFEVKHFSKYGLLDDDSDEDNTAANQGAATAADASKLKALHLQSVNVQKKPITQLDTLQQHKLASGDSPKVAAVRGTLLAPSNDSNYLGMDDSDDERENIRPEGLQYNIQPSRTLELNEEDRPHVTPLPMSHQLAAQCGVDSTNVQRMKASFLDEDDDTELSLVGHRRSTVAVAARGSPALTPLLKHIQAGDKLSPLPQSPLIRSGIKADMSTAPKLSSSFYSTNAKLDYKMEEEEEKVGSLLSSHRLSSDIQLPEPDYPLLPSGAERPLRPKTRIQGYRLQYKQLPLDKSLAHGRHSNSIIDGQITAGRRSRVGWTKEMLLAHNGSDSVFSSKADRSTSVQSSRFSILSPGRGRYTSPYQVTLETASVGTKSSHTDPLLLETRVKALRIQLRHLTHTGTTACPRLEPAPGVAALHEYGRDSLNDLDTALQSGSLEQSSFQHQILIWELAVALWGSLPEFEHMDDIDKESYLYQSARNEAFSRWLSYAANFKVEEETSPRSKQSNGMSAAIFSHLTARQIPEATKLAIESKDLRLALLLSQAGSSQTAKNLLHKQLCDWNSTGADKFVAADRLKLYVLLAGSMVWEGAAGLVNCCIDLDWKRALALHYWYSQSKLSIPSAVARYDAAWRENDGLERYAAPPLPPYMEETGGDDNTSRDTCYHLLKLYCNGGYSLDELLLSASSTPDPLNYHMSWHLMQVLSALGYTHLGEWQATAIHSRYSEQLESCGLWEWAVVPLLNLADQQFREKSIKDLLLRHTRLDVSDGSGSDSDSFSMSDDPDSCDSEYAKKEKFLRTELNIPCRWISEAKAIKAKCEGLAEEEAWHLLQCQQYNSAHRLILDRIAPEYIVRDDLDGLHLYLDELQAGSDSVSEWIIGGKIYLDYITVHDVLDELRLDGAGDADGYSLEKLRPEVESLARRLLSLSTTSPVQLLAQSMMAMHTAHNLKYLMSLDEQRLIAGTETTSAKHVVESLSLLPLQSDHAMRLLRETLSSFMLEF